MDKSAADAFIYAKASGILGKSFVNHKTSQLFNAKSLSELWNLLFDDPCPAVPEVLLAQEIEKHAFRNLINEYSKFISFYDSSEATEILKNQLYIYEAENLKEIQDALCVKEVECPDLIDLGKFSRLNYSLWPDIAAITRNSPFSWCKRVPDIHEKQRIEFKIDIQVIKELWASVEKTNGEVQSVLKDLYLNEYIIKNIVWALRLKIYYKMSNQEIKKNLIYVTDEANKNDPIAAPAISVLEKDVTNFSEWKNWKYSELINPYVNGEAWRIEPDWIEKTNRIRMNKLASKNFHQYQIGIITLISWFKIKNFELSCIRTAVESLRLGLSAKDALNTLGILSE